MASMLDNNIQQQVREMFANLQHPVDILYFGSTDSARCEYCEETKQLLSDVAELSEHVQLHVYDIDADAGLAKQYKVDGAPGFVMVGREGEQLLDYGIRFKGIPAGHEFSSLVNDVLLISRRDSNLSEDTRKFLQDLSQPVQLQVFVTPSCPYCPRAVVLAHQFALESPWVEAEMVEATEFPELAHQYEVSGVPHTTINLGAGTVVGSAPEQMLVEEIRTALEKSVVK